MDPTLPTSPGPEPRPGGNNSAAAEFDQFARDYLAGMENPLKRLVGKSEDDFIGPKVAWMVRDLRKHMPGAGPGPRLLDFGCGSGLILKHLRLSGLPAVLHGCDVSEGMLAELARKWAWGLAPEVHQVHEGQRLPYKDAAFDVVVLSTVLHHVAADLRPGLFQELARILAPAGRLYVFEHNPFHPLTRWVVYHTAIDQNAQLVSPAATRACLRGAGLEGVVTRYLLFLPVRWRWTRRCDELLGWLPAGAQYVVAGRKPGSA